MAANVGNISLATADLKKIRKDVEIYLFEDQTDFSDQIAFANTEEYRNVSKQLRLEYPGYTESEIEALISKIKDHPVELCLYHRRIFLTLAEIFSGNDKLDEADYYRHRAYEIPLRYYIDQNDDNVQGIDETRSIETRRITFGR